MYSFTVNGRTVQAERDEPLLRFLRDTLHLTSVKDGCSQGACGTCTILVDGRATRACIISCARAQGKQILTCEGLSARERAVYAGAFADAGAVQCGFCTPGMVMAAKALLDKNPSPTREQVRAALRGNLCRCTGYRKIIDAVLLAARRLRGEAEAREEDAERFKDWMALQTPLHHGVGARLSRLDAAEKALGSGEYTDDIALPGMLLGSALRSAYPRARVLSIDTSEALEVPGVVCVMTAEDLPGERKIGHLKKDYDVLIGPGEVTHFLGDAVALVAARTQEALEEAKRRIRVAYEPLTPVLSCEEAMRKGAPAVHAEMGERDNLLCEQRLCRGDVDTAIASAAHVVTRTYDTPRSEHAFLEPECAVALPQGDGVLIYCGDQGIYQTQRECAEALGLPREKVRVVAKLVGGGFGGKEDMSVQHHAALLAHRTGMPVKVRLTRDESLLIHPKRHGMRITVTTACDAQGHLTAFRARLLTDTGAYASLGAPVLQRACTHAAGPYRCKNVDIVGRAYYTNNPPGGAFRGFGVTQSCFACECNLNLLAEAVGISPWEIRRRNALAPWDVMPNGQIADETTAILETLEAVKPFYDAHPGCGIACALKNSGLGVGVKDTGRVRLCVRGGVVEIHSSAACIGQGLGTVLEQIVAQAAAIAPAQLRYCPPDTSAAPDAGNTTASRQTLFTGEAARRAALQLRHALAGTSLQALEGQTFLGEYTGVTEPMGSASPAPVSHIAYSYATHAVALGEDGLVESVFAAHDVGQPINPLSLEGQVEGGVVMSLGYALTERFPVMGGRPAVKLGTIGLLRAGQEPAIETAFVRRGASQLAFGAKGVGEIAAIPTAPAVQLAYYLRDGVFRDRLPLEGTPYDKAGRAHE